MNMGQSRTTLTDFSLRQAAALCGFSPHMLNYLDRTGVVRASIPEERRRGRHRRYSFVDLLMLQIVSRLLRHGVEVARVKKALHKVQDHLDGNERPVDRMRYLVTDGRKIYLPKKANTLEALDDGQFAFAFVLDVASVESDLRAQIRKQRLRG
jgi:DNA-binding transcriptional MerR regulator